MEHRIKIINTDYNKDYHIVMWEVKFIDPTDSYFGETRTLAYRANDLISSILGRDDIAIPPEIVIQFNNQIKGKEKKIEINSDIKTLPSDLNNISEKDFEKISSVLDKYPYKEIHNILNNE